jgi:hypothetical protein
MQEHELSDEDLGYSEEYRDYLAVRDMCRMMIALHQRDYDAAADVWKKHPGPHHHLTRHAINWLISHFARNGQDPAGWARGYQESVGSADLPARDMCRMVTALYREDQDAALEVWNQHDGGHIHIAMEAMTALAIYLVRDGEDPVERARGYEAYAAIAAGVRPALTEDHPDAGEAGTGRRDRMGSDDAVGR